MNQFEDVAHTARREEGELSVERIGELWAQSQDELLGDAVEVTDNYRSWWSYVPHFIGTPGYVYAYAYGQLLALSVYGRYLEEGRTSSSATSSCSPPAGRSRPRSWPRSPASTSPTRASGAAAWTSSSASSSEAEAAADEVMAQRLSWQPEPPPPPAAASAAAPAAAAAAQPVRRAAPAVVPALRPAG